jgi:hypothetical protein
MIAGRIVEGCYDSSSHGNSPETSNVRGHRADEMKDATGSAASEAPGGPRC